MIKDIILNWLFSDVDMEYHDEQVEEQPNEHHNDNQDDNHNDEAPPARYYVQTGSHGYWVSDFKVGSMGGIDVFWTQVIDGKPVNVLGTIYDNNISIFDYETTMILEQFQNIKKQSFEYMMQKMKEDADQTSCEKPCKDVAIDASMLSSYG